MLSQTLCGPNLGSSFRDFRTYRNIDKEWPVSPPPPPPPYPPPPPSTPKYVQICETVWAEPSTQCTPIFGKMHPRTHTDNVPLFGALNLRGTIKSTNFSINVHYLAGSVIMVIFCLESFIENLCQEDFE